LLPTSSFQALHSLCEFGAVEMPDGRSLQLVDPEEASRSSSPNHLQLEHVVAVLGDAYGPFVYQQVRGREYEKVCEGENVCVCVVRSPLVFRLRDQTL
jgi:hypothetical protein